MPSLTTGDHTPVPTLWSLDLGAADPEQGVMAPEFPEPTAGLVTAGGLRMPDKQWGCSIGEGR